MSRGAVYLPICEFALAVWLTGGGLYPLAPSALADLQALYCADVSAYLSALYPGALIYVGDGALYPAVYDDQGEPLYAGDMLALIEMFSEQWLRRRAPAVNAAHAESALMYG